MVLLIRFYKLFLREIDFKMWFQNRKVELLHILEIVLTNQNGFKIKQKVLKVSWQ